MHKGFQMSHIRPQIVLHFPSASIAAGGVDSVACGVSNCYFPLTPHSTSSLPRLEFGGIAAQN